jgi:hypothetical protein
MEVCLRRLGLILCLGASAVLIVASSSVYTTYGTGNGTAQAFVQLCPKSDGTQNAVPCSSTPLGNVTINAPSAPPINVTPVTIANTGIAVQFGAHTLLQGVTICGQHVSGTTVVNNTGTVWVGGSSVTQSTGAPLQPGVCITYTDNQSSDFWVDGASGDGATMGAN